MLGGTVINEIFGFISRLLENFGILKAILGFILVFFLPGFAWTLVFFTQINNIERIVLSFGLSIVLVTLSVFFMNVVAKMSITGSNSLIVLIIITIIPLTIYYLTRVFRHKREKDD